MLTLVIVLTIILGISASKITITMDMKDMMPDSDPKVALFNQLIDEFSSVTSVIVVAQGEEEKIKAFADDLAPKIVQLIDTTSNAKNRAKIKNLKFELSNLNQNDEKTDITRIQQQIEHLENRINFKLFKRVDYKAETEFIANRTFGKKNQF
jgi:predicted RND superfamily exporter protein